MKRKQFWGRLIVLGLIVAFALLRPKVEAWLESNKDQGVAANQTDPGQNSGITQGGELGTLTLDDVKEYKKSTTSDGDRDTGFLDTVAPGNRTTVTAAPAADSKSTQSKTTQSTSPKTSSQSKPKTDPKSSSSRPLPKLAAPTMPATKPSATATTKTSKSTKPGTVASKTEPKLGALTLVDRGREIFKSTAGLVYGRGSVDRHRLKHVLKHAKDNLSKPVHGVFASEDRNVVLEWIDTAYVRGQKGGRGVRVEEEGDRVVYTVDMGKKIGYVGGQVGERKGHPACKYLRLVVEDGNEVITAYPSQSL